MTHFMKLTDLNKFPEDIYFSVILRKGNASYTGRNSFVWLWIWCFLNDMILLIKPILLKNWASASRWHGRWNYVVVFCLGLRWNLDSCLILHLEFKNGHKKLNTRPKWMKFSSTVNMSCTWDFNEEQSQTESKLFKKYLCLNRGLHFFLTISFHAWL